MRDHTPPQLHTRVREEGSVIDCTHARSDVIDLSPRAQRVAQLRNELRRGTAIAEQTFLQRKARARRHVRANRRMNTGTRSIRVNDTGTSSSIIALGLMLLLVLTPFAPVLTYADEAEVATETIEDDASTPEFSETVAVDESVTTENEVPESGDNTATPDEATSDTELDTHTEKATETVEEDTDTVPESLLEERLEDVAIDAVSEEEGVEDATEPQDAEEQTLQEEESVNDVEEQVEDTATSTAETTAANEEVLKEDSSEFSGAEESVQKEEETEEVAPPSIELRGTTPVTLVRGLGIAYSDLGAVATDEAGGELSISVFVNGEEVSEVDIDSSIEGEYTIVYRTENAAGVSAEVERDVIVRDASTESNEDASESEDSEEKTEEEALNEEVDATEEVSHTPIVHQEIEESVDIEALRAEIKESLLEEVRNTITEELKNNCLEFDDGSYYCMNASAQADAVEVHDVPTAFSKRDEHEGDDEIYFAHNGVTKRITNNQIEDRFPHADVFGNWVVWQAQVESRWQIFAYNTQTDVVEQVTDTTYNNMNPRIYKDTLTWQGWLNNNWEVFTATYRSSAWNTKQITGNSWHDVFPSVAVGLVTWQSFENDVWSVKVHDIETGTTSQLSKGAQKYENPRFSLIWDARDEAGDVSVFEYDLSSGEIENFRTDNGTGDDEAPQPPVEREAPLPTRTVTPSVEQLPKDDEDSE